MSKNTYILCLLCWLSLPGHSQNHPYRQYTTDDGLPSNYVYGVVEDNDGYIWAYTENGLAKFDGETFRNFTTADGLPSNDVYNLAKDDTTGLLWMCTTVKVPAYVDDSSIVVLNHIQEKIHSLIKHQGKIRYNSHHFVDNKTLVLDSLLSLEQMELWFPEKAQEQNLVANYRKGNIIYGHSDLPTCSKLFKFNHKKNIFQEFSFPVLGNISFEQVLYYRVYELAQPFYMVFTNTDLYFMNLDNGEQLSYSWTDFVERPIFKNFSIDFPNNKTLQINTDKYYVFFDENLHIKQFFYPKNIASQYTLLRLCIDSQGNYWIGTREGGLFFINKEELKTSYIQPENSRGKVIEKLLWNNGKIYAINDNFSVFQLDIATQLQQVYQGSERGTFTDAIVRSNGDMLLFGGYEPVIFIDNPNKYPISLSTYPPLRDILKNLPKIDAASLINVKKTTWNEKHQYLFFASHYGLFWYNIPTANLQQIGETRHDWNIYTDTFNNITYITNQEGIYSFQKGQLQKELATQGTVTSLRAKDAQYLWIGTQNQGLLEWNKQNNQVQQISKRKYITSIWQDENRYLLGTHEGVVVLEEKKSGYQETYCYDKKDGLLTAEILDVLADSQFIYAATIKGVMKIKKDHEPMVVKDSLHRLTISSVKVNGTNSNEAALLQLQHRENNLLIDYHLLDFASKGNIEYQYQLAPLQDDWTSTTAKQVRFDELPPHDYTFYLKATDWYGNDYVLKQPLVFCIQKAFWQTWWFRGLVLVLFLATIAFFIKRREAQQEKKLADEKALNQKIANLQLQSLRAQMNPHFIFNALGSIQYFIQTHRTEEADNYLTMFARLMRKYLDSATERIVDLSTEIAMLKEYTQLEMMRFEGQFSTAIQVDDKLDLEGAVIPSMLLQPFVENAINHGLQPRTKAGGQLVIAFSKHKNWSLRCIISDNGIGRENAAKYRKKGHISRGMKNVHSRIATLRANELSDIHIQVDDLYANETINPGTKVAITFKKMTYDHL